MPILLLSGMCILSYLMASLTSLMNLFSHKKANQTLFYLFSFLAIIAHVSLITTKTPLPVALSQFTLNDILQLTTLFMVFCVFGLGFYLPLHYLSAVVYPLAALSLIGTHVPELQFSIQPLMSWTLLLHLITSLAAFSFLTVAALQAMFMALQDYLLKRRRLLGVLQRIPSMERMERMMFGLIGIGLCLLTIALIVTLGLGTTVLSQPSLAPKIFLSLVAWLVFTGLMVGHRLLGWRGRKVIYCTLTALVILGLAYFGTKLVL